MRKSKMWKACLFTLFIIPVIMSESTAGENDESEGKALYTRVMNKYQYIRSFYSKVECKIPISKDKDIIMHGVIYLLQPDKWLLRLDSDNSKKVRIVLYKISDGIYTWELDNKNNTIIKKPYKKVSNLENLISSRFFPLFKQFDEKNITLLNESDKQSTIKIMLSETESIFNHVRLDIDPDKEFILKISFYSINDKMKMSISFDNIEMNEPLDNSIFKYKKFSKLKIIEPKQ